MCASAGRAHSAEAAMTGRRAARRGGIGGPRINSGFAGHDVGTADNFAKLTDPHFAYTVKVWPAEKDIKVPAWLNDPIHYHNRGDTTFRGESSRLGDFVGLDDLMTENPRVIAGMVDIFSSWIDRFGVDGFRMDVINFISKEQSFADAPPVPGERFVNAFQLFANGPRIHEFLAEMHERVFADREGSFLTVGEDECRAWSIRRGTSALDAAGEIHSDISRGFIRAEVVGYDAFIARRTMAACRDSGELRLEGKEYVVQDGDIINFRHAT